MSSAARQLRNRTKEFALRILRVADSVPNRTSGKAIASQIVRSGTSVAANYRAACRARSKAEFAAKIGVVLEEADETLFWLELLAESGLVAAQRLQAVMQEADQLIAIFVASNKTSRQPSTKKSAICNLQSAIPDRSIGNG